MSALADLVGRTVVEVRRAENGEAVCFVDSTGEAHYYQAEGDCCANAFVHEVDAPEFLLGQVTAASEDDAPREDVEYGDVLDVTFYRLNTARGTCTIELRVEHNGYYGGRLEHRDDVQLAQALTLCPVVLAAASKASAP